MIHAAVEIWKGRSKAKVEWFFGNEISRILSKLQYLRNTVIIYL